MDSLHSIIHLKPFQKIDPRYTFSAIGGLIWIKLMLSFRLTRILGPLLKIISFMTKAILIFMGLEFIVLITFTFIGNVLFFDTEEYSTLWKAIITLISSAFG